MPARPRGYRAAPPAGGRNLQHRSRAPARLLRFQRHAGARVRGGSGGSGQSLTGRPPRGGRNQSGLRGLRMVPARPRAALPQPHRAGDRRASRCFFRVLHASGAQPAHADDAIPTERAVFTEPLARCEILEQVSIRPCEPVAVLGDGKLGLLASMLLQAHGYPVRQFGHHERKLRIAALAGVATELVTGSLPVAAFDWVVEATGSREGLRAAAALCRPRGVVILKSTLHGEISFDAAPIVVNEITVVGSRCGRFEDALPLLARQIVPVEPMIAAQLSAPRGRPCLRTRGAPRRPEGASVALTTRSTPRYIMSAWTTSSVLRRFPVGRSGYPAKS